MHGATRQGGLVNERNQRLARITTRAALAGCFLTIIQGCYHAVPIAADAPPGQLPAVAAGDSASRSSGGSGRFRQPPRCAAYFLLVENALPRPVEIYEVGHMTDRFVAYAQIGFTELPMTESSQQFIAMSRGELMAASGATEQRPGDRVALQRSCRPV
ncbi:MAG: hypothetical protein H7Z40_19405 [Phycisphaerae bacterium]|nr:hypothetical protein [Gemmatimonadaceae bacterium]